MALHTMLRLLSWNIRYDSMPNSFVDSMDKHAQIQWTLASDAPHDTFRELPWTIRRTPLISNILMHAPHIFGLQEVLKRQLSDITNGLHTYAPLDEWDHVGVGRDDGADRGEFSPICYKKSSFELVEWEYFWLSTTPERPSKGWDAGHYRICTVAQFRTLDGKNLQFTVANTHFDDRGQVARLESAKLIVERLQNKRKPIFLLGDLNSEQDDSAYQYLQKNAFLIDLKDQAKIQTGNLHTFTGFDERNVRQTVIDYVFGSKADVLQGAEQKYNVSLYGVGANRYEDGIYLSDHRPVVVDINLDSKKHEE